MKRLLAATFLVCVLTASQAAEVAGVKLEDRLRLAPGGPELVLNGAGIRTRVFFKVYVAGLYLAEKRAAPGEVLALPGPKRVSMTMLRDLGAQQLSDALVEGIRNNSNAAEQEALKARIDELVAIMNAIGEAKTGDRIQLDFLPDSGTRVVVNGEPRGKPIAGEDFYRALLRIWLGDKPVDGDLKQGLLGRAG